MLGEVVSCHGGRSRRERDGWLLKQAMATTPVICPILPATPGSFGGRNQSQARVLLTHVGMDE